MGKQLEIPLFSPDVMEQVKKWQLLHEIERLKAEIEHLKHQRAGHIGAYRKMKRNGSNNY